MIIFLNKLQDDMNLFDYNVQDRVNDFVAAAFSQASHILVLAFMLRTPLVLNF